MYQICICTSWHFSSTTVFQTMVLRLILWNKGQKEGRKKEGEGGSRGVGRAEGGD